MDSKNLIVAIALSLVVFVVYSQFFAPKPPEKPVEQALVKQEAVKKEKEPVQQQKPSETVVNKIQAAAKGKEILIETDVLKALVNTAGGVITHWELKKFREADKSEVGLTALYHKLFGQARPEKPKKELGNVQLLPDYKELDAKNVVFPLSIVPLDAQLQNISRASYQANRDSVRLSKDNPKDTLVLSYRGPSGILVEKTLTFSNDDYRVGIEIKTKGIDGYSFNLGTDFGFADKISSDASGRVGLVANKDGKVVSEKIGDIKGETQLVGMVDWFGQEDKYFTATVLYSSRGIVTSKRTAAPAEIGDLLSTDVTIKEKPESRSFTLYAGPKSYPALKSMGHGLEEMVDYGWFSILAKPMFWLMELFYNVTKNYGIAIILLTIVVRILLFYPSLKSSLSMEEMKKIQPLITEIREKYKKDPQRMNQETMNLYKEHKVNPLGGCLPMLLQFPFFIALYNVLSVSIELRQTPFISFWIKDLSVYDPYYVLPILMGVSMILMMKMTSTSMDPKQEKMMLFMNVAFIFLFAWLPAGLLLYITVSNVLSIVQQMYVHKIITAREARKPA